MPLKINKLLRMTYNDISHFFGFVPDTWWLSKCLAKEKGAVSPKYTTIIQRKSDKQNLEWSAPLSLGYSVIINIHVINASTVGPKYLRCPDWRHSQIFRNSFGKNHPWFNIYIHSPFTKSKKCTFERKKMHTSVNHAPKNKLYK